MVAKQVQSRGATAALIARYIIMILLALIFIFPVVFMFVSSFKPNFQLLQDSASLRAFLPVGDISLANYYEAFERVPILLFISNSLLVTGITVVLGLFVNSLAGYAIAHLRWRFKPIVLSVIIATLIIPFDTVAVPLLLIVSRLPWITSEGISQGWINSYQVQIIPFIANAFSIFLFVQFFSSLPGELIEAARIDGASWFQIFSRVIVPVSGPVFATVAILTFLPMWNQYLWPIMTVQSETYRPIMIGLQYFFQLNVEWGEIMAFLSIVTLPVLLFFLALQNAFIESIASSGIKG